MARPNRTKRRKQGGGSLVGKRLKLDIADMANGGFALARHGGKPVLLPYTLPGERVRAEITDDRGKIAFARGTHLVAASADRVKPRCTHFGPGRCWGCHFQHIDYPAQLLLKQDVLADQLSRLGKLPDPLIETVLRPVLPAAKPWAYSSRLRLMRDANGDWGLPRQARAGIEAISECHIAHPDLLEALAQLDFDFPRARRLTLQRGTDGAIMLIIDVEAEVAPEIRSDLPFSVNLILPDNEPVNLVGDAHSRFRIGERDFRVTAGGYMRQNIAGVSALTRLVRDAAALNGGESALDLYGGVGIFSATLATRAGHVTLVDSYPPAVTDAEANLGAFDNIDIIEGGVEAALEDVTRRRTRCDVAVVDPPGAGLGKAVIQKLARLRPKRLVYISGEPASLARDCRALLQAGYQLEHVQPIDLAPQTYFITTVAAFTR